eukprot:CAMPEP_0182812634 /NCGR_PEP_ID=MMETSP0006_2-20121128/8908_1 /TAXON_ID=97485 /ORGANISM="Prymnesium parvum, Strain Texoma1" /LENGTH=138 /DNA_ID=CAMNT_0024938671 /DNA_START=207 /DNA_END=620 /DNA_ORIENTATION=+
MTCAPSAHGLKARQALALALVHDATARAQISSHVGRPSRQLRESIPSVWSRKRLKAVDGVGPPPFRLHHGTAVHEAIAPFGNPPMPWRPVAEPTLERQGPRGTGGPVGDALPLRDPQDLCEVHLPSDRRAAERCVARL